MRTTPISIRVIHYRAGGGYHSSVDLRAHQTNLATGKAAREELESEAAQKGGGSAIKRMRNFDVAQMQLCAPPVVALHQHRWRPAVFIWRYRRLSTTMYRRAVHVDRLSTRKLMSFSNWRSSGNLARLRTDAQDANKGRHVRTGPPLCCTRMRNCETDIRYRPRATRNLPSDLAEDSTRIAHVYVAMPSLMRQECHIFVIS